MNIKEVNIGCKATADYQSVQRAITVEVEDGDTPEDLETLRDSLQKRAVEDLNHLLEHV